MSPLSDVLEDPTSVLHQLHGTYKADDFQGHVTQYFQQLLGSETQMSLIPVLDPRHNNYKGLINKTRPLVQFRGMVQSTGHEVYRSIIPPAKLGAWGLSEEYEGDGLINTDTHPILDDRNSVWAVSVPGETEWMTLELDGHAPTNEFGQGSVPQPHKYPLPGKPHLGVNVKLYGDSAASPKLTEVYTFVGILTEEPLLSESHSGGLRVPTLHVLFSRQHNPTLKQFRYPMLSIHSRPNGDESPALKSAEGSSPAERVRTALTKWIAREAFAGDEFAAEWLLLSAISRTYHRSPPVLPLTLTIANVPLPPTSENEKFPEPSINSVLELIMPSVIHVPLSIPFLNESRMMPISKEEDLHSGVLQLPAGTVVVVSDAHISQGTVTQHGLENINALKQCASSQTLAYKFPYSDYTFKTSLNFVMLAQGKSSPFIETDVTIPLQAKLPSPEFAFYKKRSEIVLPEPDVLASFRAFVCAAKLGNIEIKEDVSQYIQDDFVRERREDRGITADDLVLRMALARLMALSLHELALTKEIWERTKVLDKARKARIA